VRYHSSDGLVENTAWGTEVEGTASSRIVSGHFAEVGMVLDCREGLDWVSGIL
jgi:hypothetical protein